VTPGTTCARACNAARADQHTLADTGSLRGSRPRGLGDVHRPGGDVVALATGVGRLDGLALGLGWGALPLGVVVGLGGRTDVEVAGAGRDGLPPGEVGAGCRPADVPASTPMTMAMTAASPMAQSRRIRRWRCRSPRRMTSAGGSGRARSAPYSANDRSSSSSSGMAHLPPLSVSAAWRR
jgi:hypothetical protein